MESAAAQGSIFAAATQNAEAVAKAMVPVRIISSAKSADPFASEVTRFTNTQNAIEKRDFVALDPQQERIRQELHIEGVEYAYKSGASTGTAAKRFDLAEATVALACSSIDVTLAVQAKREIGKLWEDLSKAPYKQLFNSGVTGPMVWQAVQAMRIVDQALAATTSTYSGRENLICVHGNRFIQWAALRRLEYASSKPFSRSEGEVQAAVQATIERVIDLVKSDFADSYPASLFKNLAKCKALAGNA
jgi:hypothetical protein